MRKWDEGAGNLPVPGVEATGNRLSAVIESYILDDVSRRSNSPQVYVVDERPKKGVCMNLYRS